ncbi:GGDEF domain-containing protein [Marinobacter sp.]|uniref:sensor domain-containing diguanylate cyclase n=1 Tax=Marinobacter sp. TaxID=50741 RepID=UPI001B3E6FA1|nr:diguanylate cyclase [Marinobacter sp.]MBQ0833601.1 diguanylate cyclase [Marinobacter sp.]
MGRWLGSLVNRAVLLVVGVVVLTALLVALAGSFLSRSELEQQAENQVATIAQLVAVELDGKLSQRLEALAHVAQGFTMSKAAFEGRANILMRRQVALQHLFDGVYLIDAQGKVIAEHPEDWKVIGADVSNRSYFRQSSVQFTPLISEPYRSYYQGKPAVMVVAPVFDHQQRFIGMLGGAILLAGEHLIEEFSDIRIGKTGYLAIVARSGIVLANGRTGEVMQPAGVASPVLQGAMNGFEGTAKTRSAEGESIILSVQQMSEVPWFVAAVWPAREAYAPATRITDALLWVLLVVILVVVPVAMWRFRLLMAPLGELGQQVHERHLGVRSKPVRVSGGSEISQVAEIFNMVMDERDDVLSSLAEREAFFRSLTRGAPIGIVQADVLGRIEFVNPAFEGIIGRKLAELGGSHLFDCISDVDRDAVIEGWQQALEQQQVFRDRFRLQGPNAGPPVWCQVMTAILETPEKVMGTITIVRDISHELEVEKDLRDEQLRAKNILSVMQDGVLMADTGGVIRYANRAAGRFLGGDEEYLGKNVFELVGIDYEDQALSHEWFLERDDLDSLYVTLRNSGSGDVLDVDLSMIHIRQGRQNERLVFVLRDDAERRREEERLSWEATHDSLTQLLNRRAFNASLTKVLSEPSQQEASSVLMLIDLDHFKPVNDEGGHLLGDEMLRRLSDLFKESVRQSDTVARLGGDEFGIILPACGLARAKTLAERLRTGVETLEIVQDGRMFGVTASIGMTELVITDREPKDVVARADEGAYLAKAQGRNQVVVMPVTVTEL